MIIFQKFIHREDLKNNRDILYVFGDNWQRIGFGGQAKEMRGEPNAVGIITKRYPKNDIEAYLNDDDFLDWRKESRKDYARLENHVKKGGIVVWPADGIGTGLADLPNKAPRIYSQILKWKELISISTSRNGQTL